MADVDDCCAPSFNMSPAANLPTELLLAILDHADRGTTVLAGRVSQRWRALATTHPSYRAHIPLSISYGVTSSRVRASVSRFRSRIDAATAHGVRMEVDVSATYGTERWLYSQHRTNTHSVSAVDQTLVRAICNALPLTVTLHLSLCARIYDVFQDETRRDPAPLLERLTLLVWSYSFGNIPLPLPLDFLCGTAPLLRDVSLRNVPLTLHISGALERPSAFRSVKYLFLRLGHQHSLQSITEHFPNLKSLSIDLSDGFDVEDDGSNPALEDFDAQVAEWGARLCAILVCLGWRTIPPPPFLALLQSPVPVLDVTWISGAAEAPDDVPITPYLRHLSGPLEMSVTVGKNDWETVLCLRSLSTGMTRTFSTPAYLNDVNGSSRFLLGRDIVTQNFSDERNRDLLQAVIRFQASWKLCGEVDWVCVSLPGLERVEIDFRDYTGSMRGLLSQHEYYFEDIPSQAIDGLGRSVELVLSAPADEPVAIRATSILRLIYDYRLLRNGIRPRLMLKNVSLRPSSRDSLLRSVIDD